MIRIDIISCVPDLLHIPLQQSIVGRAQKKGHVQIVVHDLRSYGLGPYKQIDDKPYGGGAGMVLMIDPIVRCIEALQAARPYQEVIYMAPDGELLTQSVANTLAFKGNLILLCGHYKGIDERLRTGKWITKEISIGPYVLSGGELPALVVVDALVRLIPGVLGDATSALEDSFQDERIAGGVYTRPALYRGLEVPAVLRSGHAEKIAQFQENASIKATQAYIKRQQAVQDQVRLESSEQKAV